MANEINISASLSASKNYASESASKSKSFDMSGEDMIKCTAIVTTSWTAISFGAISGAPGALQLENLDDTNFVDVALANDGTGIFSRIKTGQVNLLTPATGTLYWKANVANVRMQMTAIEA